MENSVATPADNLGVIARPPLLYGVAFVIVATLFFLVSHSKRRGQLIIMHRGVVLCEERYLEHKFGDTYRQYRSKVRRYF